MEVLDCLQVMEDVDLGLKRPSTIPLTIVDFIFMVIKVAAMEEADIGINRLSTTPISSMKQVLMVMG